MLGALLLASPSDAQENAASGHRVTLAVGPLLVTQRDEHASPLRYRGTASFFEVSYAPSGVRRSLAVRLGGAFGNLRSGLTQPDHLPRQATYRGWFEVEYLRSLSTADSRTRWGLGALLAARGTVIHHLYDQSGGADAGYAFVSTTLGPVLSLRRAAGRHTTLGMRLGVPLLAVIQRPYGMVNPDDASLRSQVATMDTFQALDFMVTCTRRLPGGSDITLGYRLVVERYRDAEPFQSASGAVSLALALRVGGGE
jgi:hypothetical protein